MIEIISGLKSIGGNCVRIGLNKDEYIVIDHGLRFDIFRKYYGFFIQPIDANELRTLNILPELDVILNANSVFISHLHLDHLGSLDYLDILEGQNPLVFIPTREYFVRVLLEAWRYSWKSVLLPHSKISLGNLIDVNNIKTPYVKPILMYHSAYPSYSFIVYSDEASIVYTGDFRTKSLLCELVSDPLIEEIFKNLYGSVDYDPLEEVAGYAKDIDTIIIEGTNFGRIVTPISSKEFLMLLNKVGFENPTIFSIHGLDIESFLVIAYMGYSKNVSTIVYSPRLARFLSTLLDPKTLRELNILYTGRKPIPTLGLEYLTISEMMGKFINNEAIIITDYETVDIARMLMHINLSKPAIAVLVSSEPISEEYSIESRKQLEWLRLVGVQPYRIRVSGHYYPHELRDILKIINPRKIIPIHTLYPSYFFNSS